MNQWLQHKVLTTVKQIAGVSIRLQGKNSFSFNLVVVGKEKGKVKIVARSLGLDSYDALFEKIPKGCPVMANLEGTGVLIKPAEFGEDGQVKGQIVSDASQFIIESYVRDGKGLVSIVRKDLHERVLEEFSKGKLDLISLRSYPFSIENLSAIIPLNGEHVIGGWKFNFTDEHIESIKPYSGEHFENYQVGDDLLHSDHLVAYADCLGFFMGNYDESEVNHTCLSEYVYKKMTQLLGWGVLAFLFLTLTANYLVNDSYRKKYDVIAGEYDKNKSLLQQLKKSESDLNKKESLIIKGGLSGTNDKTWYIDRAISLMPNQLVLSYLSFNPVLKKVRPGKEILLKNNAISIEGETKDTRYVHQWLTALKKENWIKEVEMISYVREEVEKPAVFQLEITLDVE